MTVAELLDVLWRDHVASTPQARDIRRLLAAHGAIVCNDHIALRTYGVPGIDIDALARPFEQRGWRRCDRCPACDRAARMGCWQHDDTALPSVLISELAVGQLSPEAQAVIGALVDQLPGRFGERGDLPWAGRPWHLTSAQYHTLRAESEYAAWVAAFGFRVHHFAIDVGTLPAFPDLAALSAFLVEHGFTLDGGAEGAPEPGLERVATLPDRVTVALADATLAIPSCRCEFMRRHRAGGDRVHGPTPRTGDASAAMGTT